MERRPAKELAHIQGWLDRVDEIVGRGRAAYLADHLLQEAGDSLMMKVGEAANRLAKLDVLAPEGVVWALAVANRNFLIHQYDRRRSARRAGGRWDGVCPARHSRRSAGLCPVRHAGGAVREGVRSGSACRPGARLAGSSLMVIIGILGLTCGNVISPMARNGPE
jgi:uncharacterized protein with HEPN domain